MHKINLISLRSSLHEASRTMDLEKGVFLGQLNENGDFQFGTEGMPLFFIESGGSEERFIKIYQQYRSPFILLVQGQRNSLASALEILSFLKRKGLKGQIVLGNDSKAISSLLGLVEAYEAASRLKEAKLGVLGIPSDWLISSYVNYAKVKEKLGIELIDIPMSEFISLYEKTTDVDEKLVEKYVSKSNKPESVVASIRIYQCLKTLIDKYSLSGFSMRCFDLLNTIKETSCLAFAMLNEEGIIAGCEGDIPSMITMYLLKEITGQSVFMANPSRFDLENNQATYAHCTAPLDMFGDDFKLTTHFESGIGIGVKGEFSLVPFTAAKIKPDISDLRVMSGTIDKNLCENCLCRSQIAITFNEPMEPLVKDPYGNHLCFVYGDHKDKIERFWLFLD